MAPIFFEGEVFCGVSLPVRREILVFCLVVWLLAFLLGESAEFGFLLGCLV